MFTENRKFTFGADPEVFFRREDEEKHYFWCAAGLVPGTKIAPYKVPCGAVQVDGTAAEFNIDPVDNEEGFFNNIRSVLSYLKYQVAKPKGYKVIASPVAYFTEEHYNTMPDESKELGCNPDWNAYTGKVNPSPKPPADLFRTGAGHIHIGWGQGFDINDPNLLEACIHVVKHMDTCVGKPLSKATEYLSSDKFDLAVYDAQRRSLYGDFGAFRPTTYGVEYRSPSNIWLNHPNLVRYVYQNTCLAIENAFNKTRYDYTVPQISKVL